ncbi:MAG: transcriptional regulator NrdR [Pirellulales bacterium]|nr:transcriptional regulator NrdR [Pirellulales bacterium]
MNCPFCRIDNDRVIDSRASEDGFVIRRRRECHSCQRRYTTYERVEERPMKVVKKDGTRLAFDRNKMKSGIEKACWKRSVRDDQIEAIISQVENDIYEQFESEVESVYIGERIMDRLRQLDQVAYVRFASVYREFKDARDFVEELEPMLKEAQTE